VTGSLLIALARTVAWGRAAPTMPAAAVAGNPG
jgi:hypothetical protein